MNRVDVISVILANSSPPIVYDLKSNQTIKSHFPHQYMGMVWFSLLKCIVFSTFNGHTPNKRIAIRSPSQQWSINSHNASIQWTNHIRYFDRMWTGEIRWTLMGLFVCFHIKLLQFSVFVANSNAWDFCVVSANLTETPTFVFYLFFSSFRSQFYPLFYSIANLTLHIIFYYVLAFSSPSHDVFRQ